MAKSAQSVAQKWVRSMQGATQSMRDGVQSVTEAPGVRAAASVDLYKQKVMEAADSGKYADGCRSVSLEDWRRAYLEKGLQRVGTGATAAQTKQEAFFSWLLPIAEASKADVASMPKGTLEDSKARMLRNMENMSRAKYRRRR